MTDKYVCESCAKEFNHKKDLQYHKINKICTKRLDSKFKCPKCNKHFARKQSLDRHLKTVCNTEINSTTNSKLDAILSELQTMRSENNELKTKIALLENANANFNTTPITNATVNNANSALINGTVNGNVVVNNVKLVAFGAEDMSRLTLEEIYYIIEKQGFNSIIELTKKINFNPKFPEYHNVYLPNIKNKYMEVYDGRAWNLLDLEQFLNAQLQTRKSFLENLENRNKYAYKCLTPESKKFIKKLYDAIDDNTEKEIKRDLILTCYNNRNYAIEQNKRLKKIKP